MQKEKKGVGAVMITADYDKLKEWVLASIDDYGEIESHGQNYTQKFVALKIRASFSICFYAITGYATIDENIAFEHAEFVMDGFLEVLAENKPTGKYLAFADVGDVIEGEELIGFKSIEKGLAYFDTDLIAIGQLKDNQLNKGEVIFNV